MSLLSIFKRRNTAETVKIKVLGKLYDTGLIREQITPQVEVTTPQDVDWTGKNNVECVSNDGRIIFEKNRVTPEQRSLIGFYGQKWYSDNGRYCIVFSKDDESEFNIGLIDVLHSAIIYRTRLMRPHRCRVSNNGITICEDWGKPHCQRSYVVVLSISGEVIIKKAYNECIGDKLNISNDGKFVDFELNYSGKKIRLEI